MPPPPNRNNAALGLVPTHVTQPTPTHPCTFAEAMLLIKSKARTPTAPVIFTGWGARIILLQVEAGGVAGQV